METRISPDGYERLQHVLQMIDEEPMRLNMFTWGRVDHSPEVQDVPECGAVACLAGWTVIRWQIEQQHLLDVRTVIHNFMKSEELGFESLQGFKPLERQVYTEGKDLIAPAIPAWEAFHNLKWDEHVQQNKNVAGDILGHNMIRSAALLLGLQIPSARKLFLPVQWPSEFLEAYHQALSERDSIMRTHVLRSRVEHFFETGE